MSGTTICAISTGWGESTAGEDPYYCYETVETAWHILRDHVWPLIKGREFASAADVSKIFSQVRGHNMAKGGLETAIWDAEAKQKNVPLSQLICGPTTPRAEIACGVCIGLLLSPKSFINCVE